VSLVSRLGAQFRVEFAGQIVAAIAGGLLTVLLARLLNPESYGLLFLALSILMLAQVFSKLGIAKSAARYISEYQEKNPDQIANIVERSLITNLVTIATVSILFLFVHELIAAIVGEPSLTPILVLGVLFIISESFVIYTRTVAQGFEDIKLSATIYAIDRAGRLILALGLVLLGYGAIGALLGYVVAGLLASLVGFIILYVHHYQPLYKRSEMESGLFRRILEYNVPLTITSLTGKIDTQVDTILVGVFLNPIAVSFYVISKQIVEFIEMPATALGFSMSPTYGKQKAGGGLATAARMFEMTLNHTILLYLPAAIGMFLVADPTIELVFGAEYAGAVPVLQVLSVYLVIHSITDIIDQPLDFLGRARDRAIAKSIASISNVGLNIWLIPLIGVVGAAIATVITHSFYVSVKLYIIYSELPLSLNRIRREMIKVSGVSSGMAIVVLMLSQYITGPLTLIFVVFSGILTWCVLAFVIGAIDYKTIIESLS
jgi:O-antigen/teichoic acid export membrane protein